MITKKQKTGSIIIRRNGVISKEILDVIEEDGVEIAAKIVNRKHFKPGDDIPESESDIKHIADMLHTRDVKLAYLRGKLSMLEGSVTKGLDGKMEKVQNKINEIEKIKRGETWQQ